MHWTDNHFATLCGIHGIASGVCGAGANFLVRVRYNGANDI